MMGACLPVRGFEADGLPLGQKEQADSTRILHGFPHPSGANGHRAVRFRLPSGIA
jgi:hypothetical protein